MIKISPINQRRWMRFKANKRGYISFLILMFCFIVTLFAEFIANDKPILVHFKGDLYAPFLVDYPETKFGGDFETSADYKDPYVQGLINQEGWIIWPLISNSYDTIIWNLEQSPPTAPDFKHLLGTDDQGRDVLSRIIYGFRLSLLFGLTLTVLSSIIGVISGALQGYYGGWLDLIFQRFIEIWSNLPTLFLLIILSSIVQPGFWWLLGILLLFSWMGFVGVVRAEVLRVRNLDYVKASKSLGVGEAKILFKHILPNALVATLTFFPFTLASSVTALTALDFLGLGMPIGSASLGELLAQGKANLHAPWLGITGFLVISLMLTLLIYIGEGVRDAFDPRKV